MSDMPQEKQTGELLATLHTHMDCLIMYVCIYRMVVNLCVEVVYVLDLFLQIR